MGFGKEYFCSLACFRQWDMMGSSERERKRFATESQSNDLKSLQNMSHPSEWRVSRTFRPLLLGITALLCVFLAGFVIQAPAPVLKKIILPTGLVESPAAGNKISQDLIVESVPMKPLNDDTAEEMIPDQIKVNEGDASASVSQQGPMEAKQIPVDARHVVGESPDVRIEQPEYRESGMRQALVTPPLQPIYDKNSVLEKRPKSTGCFPASLRKAMVAENNYHIMRGHFDLPYICLTFDGCSLNNGTTPILRILAEHEIRATFFLSGNFIEKYPQLVAAIMDQGHEVGNHLFRHVHLTTWEENGRHDLRPEITRDYFLNLLVKNEELFYRITGQRLGRLWRAPYGETNEIIDHWAWEKGRYIQVSWTRDYQRGKSMDSLDWVSQPESSRYLSAEQIRDRLVGFDDGVPGGANGAIILMHIGSLRLDDPPAWTVLGDIIRRMRKKDYVFVTASRLINETIALGPNSDKLYSQEKKTLSSHDADSSHYSLRGKKREVAMTPTSVSIP